MFLKTIFKKKGVVQQLPMLAEVALNKKYYEISKKKN